MALVGENGAGKSSLMNVLYGLYAPDSGQLVVDGQVTRFRSPRDAQRAGIGMVHQHFMRVPTMTVTENVVLGREPHRWGRIDWKRARAEVAATCNKLGFVLDPRAIVGELSVGSQQKVEIVRALHRGVRCLVLDEPTAVLTPDEAAELFRTVDGLAASGCAVVFIGHKLTEVRDFADRIVVMRRGRVVYGTVRGESSIESLAQAMLGNAAVPTKKPNAAQPTGVAETAPASDASVAASVATPVPAPASAAEIVVRAPTSDGTSAREVVVRASSLRTRAAPGRIALKNIDLELRAGEILGIAGVDGNGQRELAQVLTGLAPFDTGVLEVGSGGKPLHRVTPAYLRKHGMAHLPEDRLHHAVIGGLRAWENLALGSPGLPFFLSPSKLRSAAAGLLGRSDVRPPEPDLRVGLLSGGNQQKLVIARELEHAPRWLVAMQPSRGLDFRATANVRDRLRAARAKGVAVLLLSLELDELTDLCDALHVMSGGSLGERIERRDFDVKAIGAQMVRGARSDA